MLPRGSRPTLQSHATPLNARLTHPQRGRTRAEQPETSSLRPPKTTVRRTPSTPAGSPERHPHLNKRTVNRRFLPGWRIQDDGIEFFRACRVPVTRYRYRGTRIPNPRGGERHGTTTGGEPDAQECARPAPKGGRRKPTREHAGRAPPADPTPTCRPGPGFLVAPPSSRGLCATAASTGRGHQQPHGAPGRGRRPGTGDPGRASTATAVIPGVWSTTATTAASTCPSPTPGDSSTRAPVASAESRGLLPAQAPPPRPRASPLQARGPFWRDGPWKDRDDPRGRNRPLGELVQPHPTPPDQRRRPVTRRRRTPLPSKPHHHRHGITNPPQNPGRSTLRLQTTL